MGFQPGIPPTPKDASAAGRTIIITGGNAGIGLETARQLLVLKAARVILACRSISKGVEAVSSLRADPAVKEANPGAKLEVFQLDLSSYESGLKFVEKVKKEVAELDILLNNGGQVVMKYEKAPTGHEKNFQVNVYTHMLITLELLPLLRSTAQKRGIPSRVTFTGSGTQISQETLSKKPIGPGETVLGHWDDPKHFNAFYRYADTKLSVSALCRTLGRVAPASELIINNPCPGLVNTKGLDRNLNVVLRNVMRIVRSSQGRSVEEGARTIVYAAVVAGAESNGKFLQHNKVEPGAAILDKPEGQTYIKRLWEEIVADLTTVDPALRT